MISDEFELEVLERPTETPTTSSNSSGSEGTLIKKATVPTENFIYFYNKLFAISSFWFGYNFVWTAVSATIMPGITKNH
jgi:hypothetical protein